MSHQGYPNQANNSPYPPFGGNFPSAPQSNQPYPPYGSTPSAPSAPYSTTNPYLQNNLNQFGNNSSGYNNSPYGQPPYNPSAPPNVPQYNPNAPPNVPQYNPNAPPNVPQYNPNSSYNANREQPYPPAGNFNQFGGMSPPMNAQMVFQKHEISPQMVQKLQMLNQYKIVFILDDSGSMNTIDTPMNQQYGYNSGPSSNMSRWDELLQFVNTSLEIALVFNPQGCDVHFLNRQAIRQCRDVNQLRHVFQNRPQGVTPLTRTIQQVINENAPHMLQGKQLLLVVATDGEPTDMHGQPNVPEFKQCLFNRPQYVFTSIVACTNDQNSVGYLNNLDRELPRLDVVDDYKSEFAEVKRTKGPQFPFSFGDYIAKTLLGSVDPDMDRYDE